MCAHVHTQSYRQGGGHKQRYRIVDFARAGEVTGEVVRLEYDPNRSAWIALVQNTETKEVGGRTAPSTSSPFECAQLIGACCL